MAHTPGPWSYIGSGRKLCVGDVKTLSLVAKISERTSDAEQISNATLITASPDLRRFAQEIAALDPHDFDAHMGEALIRRARALVVKADGAT